MRSVFYFASCDDHYTGRFDELRRLYPLIRRVDAVHYGKALRQVSQRPFTTEKFFIIDDDEVLIKKELFLEELADENFHIWSTDNPDKFAGIKLISKADANKADLSKELRFEVLKHIPAIWHEELATRHQFPPTDIVFLAYDEPNADANLEILQRRFGDRVRVVKGVTGIDKAFTACSEAASTSWFYVVNADSKVVPTFDFSFYPAAGERHLQHVWMTQNGLIPDLIYGYGGIKLFHKKFFRDAKFDRLDFTTHLVDQKYHNEVASIMQVVDERQAFRAAFRESAKLKFQGDPESIERLALWLGVDRSTKLKAATLAGAALGSRLAEIHPLHDLHLVINHFPAIDAYFNQAKLWWQDVSEQ